MLQDFQGVAAGEVAEVEKICFVMRLDRSDDVGKVESPGAVAFGMRLRGKIVGDCVDLAVRYSAADTDRDLNGDESYG